ncbi:MAG: hypothetical protein IPP82_08830 [Xanthomonadales bacterium]|nr:hypothetical protein [Xanthomonadales bacterium]
MRPQPSTRDGLLQHLQSHAFAYFQNETNLVNGLVLDKTAPSWPASIAATGLALASYPVAVQRGLMAREQAIERTLATLRFFWNSPQGTEPDATGYRGFYYHFLDLHNGRRAWECELSTVDTAFLVAGMLTAAAYFTDESDDQCEIRSLAEALYRRVDWRWAQAGGETLCHGWKPESGFLHFRWRGYDEALLMYTLALGSPTHPVSSDAYAAWCSTYAWKRCYDIDYLYAGPLFIHQLSHVWIDFRGIQDAFMREKGIDYFENSRRATEIQQRYAMDNPLGFVGYDHCCFGITASDGPGPRVEIIDGTERRFYDYEGRGAPFGIDDGTLAPWAVVASLPFAPEIVFAAIDHFTQTLRLHDEHAYGFRATFNQTLDQSTDPATGEKQGESNGWVSPYHFGLNVGPIVLMVENYRSGMVWELMRNCRHISNGLRKAGFQGGWLEHQAPPRI